MQSLKNKILEGFFTNVGADPFINWINEVFKTTKVKYCSTMFYVSDTHADSIPEEWKYRVTKADSKSLLFSKKGHESQSIIIKISEIPELLNIKPNDMYMFCTDNKDKNIKFLFGQLIRAQNDTYTFINNVLLTIDKKTGTIIDKEITSKFLIDVLPF